MPRTPFFCVFILLFRRSEWRTSPDRACHFDRSTRSVRSGEISPATFQIHSNRNIASPSYGVVPARGPRGRRGRKNEERPLSRQQVAASSPYRRGATAWRCHVCPSLSQRDASATRALALLAPNLFGALLGMTIGVSGCAAPRAPSEKQVANR